MRMGFQQMNWRQFHPRSPKLTSACAKYPHSTLTTSSLSSPLGHLKSHTKTPDEKDTSATFLSSQEPARPEELCASQNKTVGRHRTDVHSSRSKGRKGKKEGVLSPKQVQCPARQIHKTLRLRISQVHWSAIPVPAT